MQNKVSILAVVLSIVLAIGLMLVLIFAQLLGVPLFFGTAGAGQFGSPFLWGIMTCSAVVAFIAASLFGNWLQKRRQSHQRVQPDQDK